MYDQMIPRRIRELREQRQLAGRHLAKMAGISPSYLSLIESGRKVPSKDVAERLARVLGDDPDLYRWVETAGDRDLAAKGQRLEKIRQMRLDTGATLHRRGRSRSRGAPEMLGEEAGDLLESHTLDAISLPEESPASPIRSTNPPKTQGTGVAARIARLLHLRAEPETLNVPLLPEGTDPARSSLDPARHEETIAVDANLLPDDPRNLFAYRVTARGIERVKNLVQPGDVLVLAANPEGVDPTAVYAIRLRSKIVLSRIVYSHPMLLLMGSDHYQEPIQLEVGNTDGLFTALAGVVVTGIRTWARPTPFKPRSSEAQLGRSGKLEDGNIVRDCEWKENYGWRPVQKADDMDYLDAHPGTTVQFRLVRDGEVRFVLEMGPEQWREALGSYYEGPTWRRNGYIVAITKRVGGEYTEEFQERWAGFVGPG